MRDIFHSKFKSENIQIVSVFLWAKGITERILRKKDIIVCCLLWQSNLCSCRGSNAGFSGYYYGRISLVFL